MGVILTIVRHGNTFEPGEPPRRIGARTDLPLVASGRAQANALGLWFREQGIRFDRVLSSPLSRTRETAEHILALQDDPPAIEPCDWLAEIDHGPDENQPEADVVARIGAAALNAWDRESIPPPGWEVDPEYRRAAWRGCFDATAAGADRNLLLVTSNGAARFALTATPELFQQMVELPSLKLRTGAFGRILLDAGRQTLGGWDLRPVLASA